MWVLESTPSRWVADDSLRSLLAYPKLSCLIKVVMTSTYQFSSSVLCGGVICPIGSALDMAREAVWVVASVKPVSCSLGLLPNGSAILPKPGELGWGHWLVTPGLTLPKPWKRSHLVNMTCSLTISLNSMTLPAKGWKSGLSRGLSSSTQYCSPLAWATVRRKGCCHTPW